MQQDGRIANQDLAQRVHLSPSACLRRVKALEDSGVIDRYVALLNPKRIGRHGTSYTIVNLESTQPAQLGACRTWGVDSEKRPQRGQFLPDLQAHSSTMGQKAGKKWTAEAVSQPTFPKPDRLLEAFEQAVRDAPEILDCFYVAGANDYLVRFAYRDAEDLERLHAEVLARLPGVMRSNSMLVLRTVKKTTALAV